MADEIIKVLDDLARRMGVVIDWSAENALPYAMELGNKIVRYELWTSVIMLTPFVLTILGLIITTIKMMPAIKKGGDEGFEITVGLVVAWSVVIFATIAIGGFQISDIIACTVFPEKIILEYLQRLM